MVPFGGLRKPTHSPYFFGRFDRCEVFRFFSDSAEFRFVSSGLLPSACVASCDWDSATGLAATPVSIARPLELPREISRLSLSLAGAAGSSSSLYACTYLLLLLVDRVTRSSFHPSSARKAESKEGSLHLPPGGISSWCRPVT